MTRRAIFLKILQRHNPSIPDGPSDALQLNLFAESYARFVEKFNLGITDIRAWEETCRRGQKLFGKPLTCA